MPWLRARCCWRLALVFNALKLFTLPNGGSVDLAMIPIFIFALRWGVGWGLLEGFLFGLLQMLIDGAVAWGWQSLLLDYLVAFTPLGLAGLFRGKGKGIYGRHPARLLRALHCALHLRRHHLRHHDAD